MTNFTRLFERNGWFIDNGCYVLFDGQFGSTGKGLLASFIAEHCGLMIDTTTTNAGPNSGHTGYYRGEKILTQQIPVASIVMDRMGIGHACYINAGAQIEPRILGREFEMYQNQKELGGEFIVNPFAAVIKPEHQGDQHSDIASTGKGTGPAQAYKLSRKKDAVFGYSGGLDMLPFTVDTMEPQHLGKCFVETAQGWSLGINSGFYPYTTSRECSVAQAIADLGVSPYAVRKSIVSLRTYPIRVGNTSDGYSGDVYDDQEEVSFEFLGVEPELTTVTGRVRRIFTWSRQQFQNMLRANRPDALFINFMNYLKTDARGPFIQQLVDDYTDVMGIPPEFVLAGYGPYNDDVRLVWEN